MEKSHEEGTGPVNVIPRVSPSPAICKEWRLEPEMLAVTGKGKGGFGVGERGAAQSASLRGGRGFMEQEGERRAFLVDEAPLPTVPVHQGGSCSLCFLTRRSLPGTWQMRRLSLRGGVLSPEENGRRQ